MAVRMLRFGLSFIVGLGCWIGQLQAQAPAVNPAAQVTQAPAAVVPTKESPVIGRPDGRMRDWLHRNGYACGQSLNWYGCGGWHQQCTFVFGSCRTFFGEPCLPHPQRGDRNGSGTGNCR